MKAAVLHKIGQPLKLTDVPVPKPTSNQSLIKVSACGVCRTDLHIVDGELENINYPIIPGHQIVGRIVSMGKSVKGFSVGDRVGISWLGKTCGKCNFCQVKKENLCEKPQFTGLNINGGFAQFATADYRYCFSIPKNYPDLQAAPLLCAGLIGYRSYKMAGNGKNLGLYGFGSSAHIVIQVARHEKKKVFVFTREGDKKRQNFAYSLGAFWAGSSKQIPSEKLDAAIIFAPVGNLIPMALKAVKHGGIVICAGIHMSNIPSFPYKILWGEKTLKSVSNLTREDGEELLQIAPKIPVRTHLTTYQLNQVNQALSDLRGGKIEGSAVLVIK